MPGPLEKFPDGGTVAGDIAMPVWLQIAGAIASALLSYFTRYSDKAVRDMVADLAENFLEIFIKLDEISLKIDKLQEDIDKLPEKVRKLLQLDELSRQHYVIKSSYIRFKTAVSSGSFEQEELEFIFQRVVEASTILQSRSEDANVEQVPFLCLLVPHAFVLEIAILIQLGPEKADFRQATIERYQKWFAQLLDPSIKNSVASAELDSAAKLQENGTRLRSGLLGPAMANPGVPSAIYALEHRIGSTVMMERDDPKDPSKRLRVPWSTQQKPPWISLYAVTTLEVNRETPPTWSSAKIERKRFTRIADSNDWIGPSPPWKGLRIHSFDSANIDRFQGQTDGERVRDVENNPAWRSFVNVQLPEALASLERQNELIGYEKMASDVKGTLKILNEQIAGLKSIAIFGER
ncbi:hypothetical protein GOC40_12240 [Sinorhizobium meliloti]|nr:hypothetical protein [Sinorhizobium meliloti]MDX0218762.1 hypothetical protein [Sinorhizobium meliloti]